MLDMVQMVLIMDRFLVGLIIPHKNSLLEVLQLYRLNGNKIASFYKHSEVKTKFYYPFKRYKLLSLYLWYNSHTSLELIMGLSWVGC